MLDIKVIIWPVSLGKEAALLKKQALRNNG